MRSLALGLVIVSLLGCASGPAPICFREQVVACSPAPEGARSTTGTLKWLRIVPDAMHDTLNILNEANQIPAR